MDSPKSQVRSRRIMVVEDDQAHRGALERHLLRTGFDVLGCDSAEQALARFATFNPELVISDNRMPGMSGIELLATLRERVPGTRTILVTAYDDVQVTVDAMKLGAIDFLMKPLDLDELDAAIGRALPIPDAAPAAAVDEERVGVERRLVGRDPQMLALYKVIGKVAGTDTPVLIRGETGTGKELVARTIHENSGRKGAPFICVNCAALPDTLLESELFGHLKGSFTGATGDRRGRFELATEGTILLDEVGDTSAAFQAKLLRVLQEGEFYPVGGETPRHTNARVIAATHRDIEEMTHTGAFRQDLFFRIRVVELVVPPLRARRKDLPRLARHLVAKAALTLGKTVPAISDSAMAALMSYDWPGNVRELENAIMRAVVLGQDRFLKAEDFALDGSAAMEARLPTRLEVRLRPLAEMERDYVQHVLAHTGGHKSRAARILRVSRGRLDRIIEKHGLTAEFS